MAARLTSDSPIDQSSSGRVVSCAPQRQSTGVHPGVVSVSPQKIEDDAPLMVRELRSVMEQARAAATSLAELTAQGRQCAVKSAKASLHLQERLRLGARMLKAFSTQINRIEHGIERLDGREQSIESKLRDVELRISKVELAGMGSSAAGGEPPGDRFRREVIEDIGRLADVMRDVAQRVDELAAASAASQPDGPAGRNQGSALIEAKPDRAAAEANPPLRLRSWVGGA